MLFVDGRNAAYRAIYANKEHRYHSVVVMLRFIRTWLSRFKPSSVHVFWDTSDYSINWRRQVFQEYKQHRQPDPDIIDDLRRTQVAALELFDAIGVKQYARSSMEADDLIYAACRVVYPTNVVIVSSDGDYKQIPFFMPNVILYEPRQNKVVVVDDGCNPAIQKVIMGDKSDNIDGYRGIGPVKSAQIAKSCADIMDLASSDFDKLRRNLSLIDLSLCPHLLDNQLYVMQRLSEELWFDNDRVMKIVHKYKLNGVVQEYDRIIVPYKKLSKVKEPATQRVVCNA